MSFVVNLAVITKVPVYRFAFWSKWLRLIFAQAWKLIVAKPWTRETVWFVGVKRHPVSRSVFFHSSLAARMIRNVLAHLEAQGTPLHPAMWSNSDVPGAISDGSKRRIEHDDFPPSGHDTFTGVTSDRGSSGFWIDSWWGQPWDEPVSAAHPADGKGQVWRSDTSPFGSLPRPMLRLFLGQVQIARGSQLPDCCLSVPWRWRRRDREVHPLSLERKRSLETTQTLGYMHPAARDPATLPSPKEENTCEVAAVCT